jgi:hypothetical protein
MSACPLGAAELDTSTTTGIVTSSFPSEFIPSNSISTLDSFAAPDVRSVEAFRFLTNDFCKGCGRSVGKLGVNGGSAERLKLEGGDLERARSGFG